MGPDATPNRARLVETASRLAPLLHDVVFVGGHLVDLLITDQAAYRTRPTDDVDIVVQCTSRVQYAALMARIATLGFTPDTQPDAPLCRTRTRDGYVLDVMPLDEQVLGFANRWYGLVLERSQPFQLTDTLTIRIASAPVFLLTKWEAFGTRGASDPYGSHDLEDIIMLLAGRPELVEEVASLPSPARMFLQAAVGSALAAPWFRDVIEGALPDARVLPGVVDVVQHRFRAMHAQVNRPDTGQ